MASLLESSLSTTNSSTDFLVTIEEHFCVTTSTPLKYCTGESHQSSRDITDRSDITTPRVTKSPLGSPPPLPTTPKPVTAITTMTIENMSVSLTRTTDSQERLRNIRQAIHLGRCPAHTDSLGIRDQQIKRRYSEIRHRRSKMSPNSSGRSQDSSTSSEELSFNRTRFASGYNRVSQSESGQCRFSRNSETRRAKVWKGPRVPMSVSAVDFYRLTAKPELSFVVQEESSTSSIVQVSLNANQKDHKPPGFHLREFIQKKFRAFIQGPFCISQRLENVNIM